VFRLDILQIAQETADGGSQDVTTKPSGKGLEATTREMNRITGNTANASQETSGGLFDGLAVGSSGGREAKEGTVEAGVIAAQNREYLIAQPIPPVD
jgi:hypothetical protein